LYPLVVSIIIFFRGCTLPYQHGLSIWHINKVNYDNYKQVSFKCNKFTTVVNKLLGSAGLTGYHPLSEAFPMSQSIIRSVRTAQYKGKAYILCYIGATKFGPRAQLGFWGPSGTRFWVDANLVQETAPCDINEQGWRVTPAAPAKAYTPVQQVQAPSSSEDELLEARAAQYAAMDEDLPF
jgi:hypothetical protein